MNDEQAEQRLQELIQKVKEVKLAEADEIHRTIDSDALKEKKREKERAKNKLEKDFETKWHEIHRRKAIRVSREQSKARLQAMKTRNDLIESMMEASAKKLANMANNKSQYENLVSDLITQGLLKLMETEVIVRCRKMDEQIVQACFQRASTKFTDIVQQKTGVQKNVTLSLDTKQSLAEPPRDGFMGKTCSGGVVLLNSDRSIAVNNTLDARLHLVAEECSPVLRTMLFGHQ